MVALLAAVATLAQHDGAPPVGFGERVEVIARSVYVDVLDDSRRAVGAIPAGSLTLIEDGVARPVLEVRLRPAAGTGAAAPAGVVATAASGVHATPAPRFVLVALDPVTLGRQAWKTAIAHLDAAAEALVGIGPVDVVALTTPPLRAATGTTDAAAVRGALARVAASVTPLDRFYLGRFRVVRELEQVALQRSPLIEAQRVLQELTNEEEPLLRDALGRFEAALSASGRPLVAVWAAQGDPDAAGFVRSLLSGDLSPSDAMPFTASPLGALTALEETWQRWAADGVSVVSWSRGAEAALAIARVDVRLEPRGRPLDQLGLQPLTLFQSVAEATGGALAQSEAQLGAALASAGGRFELVYQTTRAEAGWRTLHVEVKRAGWTVRHPPRVLVLPSPDRETSPTDSPLILAVDLEPERLATDQPGREIVRLPVLVDLAPLRERLGPGAPARFAIRLLATPPGGKPLARVVDVNLESLPPDGRLRYETTLVVPVGTSAYTAEVSEATTGALGAAGPVDLAPAAVAAAEATSPASPANQAAASVSDRPGVFTDAAEVRIGEARFVAPEGLAATEPSVRVLWRKHEQRLVRIAGGAGSPLELGVAIDVSYSVAAERSAFLRQAGEAAARQLAAGDRVFRVDFGSAPRFLGEAHGGPGTLFAEAGPAPPEETAIFDGLSFALDRFAGHSDRAALIVFTDGCETAGRTGWAEVERAARTHAIPVFVVVADGEPCLWRGSPAKGWGILWEKETVGFVAASPSRFHLRKLAERSGGLVLSLRNVEQAGDVWSQVEGALGRLWVAVFEPSDPSLDPREVEVRAANGRVLRPGV